MRNAFLVVIVLLSSFAYLALAIWGEGGWAAFFSHPPLIALTVVFSLLVAAAPLSRGNLSPGVREDRGNRWVLAAFTVIGLLDGWLPTYTDRREFLTLDGDLVRWIGVALFAAGGALRIWPVFVLGRRFSGLVAIQPGHTLETSGVYGLVRNPSYLGLLVATVGWGLAFRASLGVALAAAMVPPLIARIRSEEGLLASEFGEAYAAYRARTWRLVPWIY